MATRKPFRQQFFSATVQTGPRWWTDSTRQFATAEAAAKNAQWAARFWQATDWRVINNETGLVSSSPDRVSGLNNQAEPDTTLGT